VADVVLTQLQASAVCFVDPPVAESHERLWILRFHNPQFIDVNKAKSGGQFGDNWIDDILMAFPAA
jgi:hypothetical protein